METAVRSQAKIKLAMSGTSGSGKTLSSLLLGYGLVKAQNPDYTDEQVWQKICIIDTENKSGSLYVGHRVGGMSIGSYNKINLSAPFSPQVYIEAIEVAQRGGIEYLVIDSLSHAWQGEGGMLDIQGNLSKRSGNSYTAWREVTPMHNRLVDKIMQSDMHVCMTMRSKTEYVIEEDERGRKVPRKVGMAPVFRDGIEFETTLFFEIDQNHIASANKDRTGLFDGRYFMVSPETGEAVWKWLSTAEEEPQKEAEAQVQMSAVEPERYQPSEKLTDEDIDGMTDYKQLMEFVTVQYDSFKDDLTTAQKRKLSNEIKDVTNSNSANFKALTESQVPELQALLKHFNNNY